MTAVVPERSSPWPALVWRADALRDLDARSRGELEASGEHIQREAGEKVFAQGDAADALFVVLSGEVEVRAVRRGDASTTLVRRATTGDFVGEDAVARIASARTSEAVCTTRCTLARISAHILLRALTRSGASLEQDPRFRALARAALSAAMQGMAFVRDLPERDLGALVDAATPRTVARGQAVFRAGERAREIYFVADGAVQLEMKEPTRTKVIAYVGRGDFFGDEEALARASRTTDAIAAGPAWLLVVPLDALESVALRNRDALVAARRVRKATPSVTSLATETRHGLGDIYRLDVARSLLVIDQEQCVRCGHCATSCADAHGDGVARIVRRGDKVQLTILDEKKSLSLPSSCQHCVQPACMLECPTGAIGRDEHGDVFIKEALCTGCGACVKACPWDNVELALHGERLVAVKCDLCAGSKDGPACVAACPVGALDRIEPRAVVAELRDEPLAHERPKIEMRLKRASAFIAGAVAALVGFVALQPAGPRVSGEVTAVLTLLLAAYGPLKRMRWVSRLAPHTSTHLSLGMLTLGAAAAHLSQRPYFGLGSILGADIAGALTTGVFGALMYATLPSALARLEPSATLPEDLPELEKTAERNLLCELSGKSEGQKALFLRVLDPYRRSRLGVIALVLSGRSHKEERDRLRALVKAILGERAAELDTVVRSCVELRALSARRWLERGLGVWLPAHVAFAVIALVLATSHAYAHWRYP